MLSFDLSKAFDLIYHHLLIQKLCNPGLNIPNGFTLLINDNLKNRTQRTKISNTYSATTAITSAVPQGSIAGPILFSLYTADIKYTCDN